MIAWAVLDPRSGELEHDHGHEVMGAASTIKLFIYSAFRRSELSPENLTGPSTGGSGVAEYLETPLPVADHAFLMLAVSDNASTNLLLDRLGFDAVNVEIERLGLANTRVRRKMMDKSGPENETTAVDLATGLAKLLDEPFADDMLQALRVSADLSSYLPHLLPGATVASKWGNTETVRHEVAYLTQDETELVTAVCSTPPEPPDVLARIAADTFVAARP